jgi:hypothetical protein
VDSVVAVVGNEEVWAGDIRRDHHVRHYGRGHHAVREELVHSGNHVRSSLVHKRPLLSQLNQSKMLFSFVPLGKAV